MANNNPERDSDDLRAQKKLMRRNASHIRNQLHKASAQTAADELAAHGMELLSRFTPAILSGFMPFGSEINPQPLMLAAAEAGWTLALPVVIEQATPLQFRQWSPGDELEAGRWSIPVPLASAKVVDPDFLLVPLLAYDKRGYRLGYGGGFYDRTLQQLKSQKPATAIGVAFHGQRNDDLPIGNNDYSLDWLLSEREITQFPITGE